MLFCAYPGGTSESEHLTHLRPDHRLLRLPAPSC